MLGVEGADVAAARGVDERIFLHDFRRLGHGAVVRLLKIGNRLLVIGLEHVRVQFHAAGDRLETGLPVVAQIARLVLAVLVVGLDDGLLAQFLDAVAVVLLQLGVEEVINRGEVSPDLGAHALAHVDQDLEVAFRVGVLHRGVHSAHEVLVAPVVRRDQAIVLGEGRKRQNQIAQAHDGRGHEDILSHDEIEVLHRRVPTLRLVGHTGERVRADKPAHAQRVILGIILVHALEPVQKRIALNAAHGSARVEHAVLARGVNDMLLRHALGERVGHVIAPLSDEARRLRDGDSAGHVNVAANGANRHEALCRLRGLLGLVKRNAPGRGRRRIRREGACGSHELLRVDPGNLLDLLGRPRLHRLGELLEAVAPLFNEIVIVEVLGDDDVQKAHADSSIGAGAQLQVILRVRTEPGQARVHGDDLRAALHDVDDAVAEEAVGARVERVLAPHHDVLRANPARIVVAIGEELRRVDFRHAGAQEVVHDGRARAVARLARERVGRCTVRRVHDSRAVHRGVKRGLATRARQREDALGTVVFLKTTDLLLEQIVGLVPRNLLPCILAAILAGTLHGAQQAVLVVDDLVERDASRAQTALRDRMARVALHLHNLSVLHVDEHAASNRMISWRRPCTGADFQYPVFFGDEWLARSASFSHFTPPPLSVSRRPRQTFASFRTTWTLRFGSWGEKDPSRGVSDTPPRHERQTPRNGGSNYPLQVSPGKTKWCMLRVGKGERLCRATPARTATSAECSLSRLP